MPKVNKPLPEALTNNTGFLLMQAIKKAQRNGVSLNTSDDLRLPQYSIVAYILDNPGSTQEAVAKALQLDASNMAKMVRQLECHGYIKRARHGHDARAYALEATKSGVAWQ